MSKPDGKVFGVESLEAWRRHVDPNGLYVGKLGKLAMLRSSRQEGFSGVNSIRGRFAERALGTVWQDRLKYSGLDSVFAEAATLGQVSKDDATQLVGSLVDEGWVELDTNVQSERFFHIAQSVERHTEDTAERIVSLVGAILDEKQGVSKRKLYSRLFGIEITSDMPPLVLTGLLMSGASHQGQKRLNENRPYETHPLATAFLYQMAWNEAAQEARKYGKDVPDEKWLERQIFVNLMHDTIENQLHHSNEEGSEENGKSYMEGISSRVTPLLLQKVLEKLGENEEAKIMTEDVLRITKTFGPDGETTPPDEYLARCAETIRAMIAKFSDTVHNKLIDPKNGKNSVKLEKEYTTTIETINRMIAQGTSDSVGMNDAFGLATIQAMYRIAMGDPLVGRQGYGYNHDQFMTASQKLALGQGLTLAA